MNLEAYNHGPRFKINLLIGLRHPESEQLSAHGAFVVAQLTGEGFVRTCSFYDGAEITSTCSPTALDDTITYLLHRRWVWMGQSDIMVACHGMSLPCIPFWITMDHPNLDRV